MQLWDSVYSISLLYCSRCHDHFAIVSLISFTISMLGAPIMLIVKGFIDGFSSIILYDVLWLTNVRHWINGRSYNYLYY